ncbi:alpha/beta hydrolase [Patiriisocius marinistellae]|uniref:Alpha/beta hydrolase n=1 Tax=Patiriisocius marinistellae TaxID=2494560 RepID=A0A5J4FZB8_9FLAO|nr:alpha/beta hydrolase [Patiriisocius marinistellae]GEQ85031.1 alpha/beta hydrolase [Patiriisocius marinistellae]
MKNIIIKSIGAWINFLAIVAPKKAADVAFNLLIKVRRAPISEKGKEFLAKGEQHYFEVNGQSAVLHHWGNGPIKLLFLHGWESNSQRWLPYFEKLDMSKFTMYALDAPGHGMAKGKTLNIEVFRQSIVYSLDRMNGADAIIGHSLSNTAISYMYSLNPEINVQKYVVMGAASGMDAIFVYFKNMLGLSNKTEAALSAKINTILKIPNNDIKLKNFLDTVKQPLLLVHDEEDNITPYAPIKSALKNHPEIKTYITTGLKHDLKREDVYNTVIDFIKRDVA